MEIRKVELKDIKGVPPALLARKRPPIGEMDTKCTCGEVTKSPVSMAGKLARCLGCGKPLKIVTPQPNGD
jgi:hypothetical protein